MANTSNANNQTRAALLKRVQGQPPALTRQSPTVRVSLPEIFWVSGKNTFTYLTKGIISTPRTAAVWLKWSFGVKWRSHAKTKRRLNHQLE